MSEFDYSAQLLGSPSKDKWARIGIRRRTGLLVPLFSVHSRLSQGIGDLGDLNLLVDLCRTTGHSIIQLLPLNELGGLFCPYDAVSSFALEPAYLSLNLLAGLKDRAGVKNKVEALKKMFPLEDARYVDYKIKKVKTEALRELFSSMDYRSLGELEEFMQVNKYWIADFALFKVLKVLQRDKPWYEWEDQYKNRDPGSLADLRKGHEKEFMFEVWLQWQLYRQFKEVKGYAAARRVLIKGDLPILVSRDSADVWAHPGFFKLGFAAGAPPDMYCAKGQRWGMPPYNWEALRAAGYFYLKEKLRYAENFYDILRIDHVVGLFRIWSIPYHEPLENQGLNGFFDPADESVWGEHGRGILSVMLESTGMLFCAEDLGVIPEVCTRALRELGIPGNAVQRWAKDWNIRHDFLAPEEYRPFSVAMLSTHDTTNWAAWWENEAGTVDEAMFVRRCAERGIDFEGLKGRLFEASFPLRGRLRWSNSVSSPRVLAAILGRREEEIKDFVDIYENTFQEKDKLWRQFGLRGRVPEKAGSEIIRRVFKSTLNSRAIFCIQSILDWLILGGILEGDAYQYRINTPGTISSKNWSCLIPLPLEGLMRHKVCGLMKNLIGLTGRVRNR